MAAPIRSSTPRAARWKRMSKRQCLTQSLPSSSKPPGRSVHRAVRRIHLQGRQSRRPGFSKRQLAAGLDERGIGYVHLQKLGTPKEGRLAARSGHADEMLRIFERHLNTPEAQHELDELTALAKALIARSSRPLCLLCYERDPAHCHRQRLADELHARLGLKVEHLFCTPVPLT